MIFILSLFIYRALLTRLMYIRIQMVPKMVGWGSKLHLCSDCMHGEMRKRPISL